jgi:hypothetical protein
MASRITYREPFSRIHLDRVTRTLPTWTDTSFEEGGRLRVFEDLGRKISMIPLGVRNAFRLMAKNKIKNLTYLEEGEHHLPLANFAGPGTHIKKRVKRGDLGTTKSDEIARIHDITYDRLVDEHKEGRLSDEEFIKLIREADNIMIESLGLIEPKKTELLEILHKHLAKKGIEAKRLLEDYGILSAERFAQPGKGKDPPEAEANPAQGLLDEIKKRKKGKRK